MDIHGNARLITKDDEKRRGDDLVVSEIYHAAKFHRSMPTHSGDICYQNPVDRQTDKKQTKKTVNDISPACLSACGDNSVLVQT